MTSHMDQPNGSTSNTESDGPMKKSSHLEPLPLTMPAWRRTSEGNLHLQEVGTPVPSRGEALIRIAAAGLNPVDAKASFRKVKLSTGVDGAGEIISFGEGTVTDLKVGTRAMFHASLHAMRNGRPEVGSFAAFSIVPLDALVTIPDHISFIEAAALPCPAGTAQQIVDGLYHHLSNTPFSSPAVFVQGASGAVARFVVQLLRKHHPSVEVIGSASKANHADLKELGVIPVSYSDSSGNSSPVIELEAVDAILASKGQSLAAIVNFQGGESVDLHYARLDSNGKLVCVLNSPTLSKEADSSPLVGKIALGQAYDVYAGVVEPAAAVEAYQDLEPLEAVTSMAHAYRRVVDQIHVDTLSGIKLPRIEVINFEQIGESLSRSGKLVANLQIES